MPGRSRAREAAARQALRERGPRPGDAWKSTRGALPPRDRAGGRCARPDTPSQQRICGGEGIGMASRCAGAASPRRPAASAARGGQSDLARARMLNGQCPNIITAGA